MGYRCLLLIARQHGLEALRYLIRNKEYEILAIFTHKLNPKSEDPERKTRSDFNDYLMISNEYSIPLYTIDYSSEKARLEEVAGKMNYDFLISISWRFLIPNTIFSRAHIGSFNIHRGDLPKYAGAEPIKRALLNKEERIAVCSHTLTENYDEGKVICKTYHPVNYDSTRTLEENVERLKREITPYFTQLLIQSTKILLDRHGDK